MQTGISTLQLLVQRFWYQSNLGLLAKCQLFLNSCGVRRVSLTCLTCRCVVSISVLNFAVLQYVCSQHLGKSVVAAGISQWSRAEMKKDMTNDEQEQIVAVFKQNVAQHLQQRKLGRAQKRKITTGEQDESSSSLLSANAPLSMPTGAVESNQLNATSTVAASASSIPATFIPLFSGCVHHVEDQPSALDVVDLPLHAESAVRASPRIRLQVQADDLPASGSQSRSGISDSPPPPAPWKAHKKYRKEETTVLKPGGSATQDDKGQNCLASMDAPVPHRFQAGTKVSNKCNGEHDVRRSVVSDLHAESRSCTLLVKFHSSSAR